MISQLNVYPVKSCKGISVKTSLVKPTGLSQDRRWVVVREDGRFITQRQEPRLCLVETHLPGEVLQGQGQQLGSDAALTLAAPGVRRELRVPLQSQGQPLRPVSVWEFSGLGYDEGDEAAAWLTAFLGQPARLVRYAGSEAPDSRHPPGSSGSTVRMPNPEFMTQEMAFADGFPVLVATEEAMADLNRRMGVQLDINRFRANIVLRGTGEPWADDAWRSIRIGGLELCFVKPCSRCNVTQVDQQTGQRGQEPLKTLAAFRTGRQLGYCHEKGSPRYEHANATFFGWNATVTGSGLLHVGDRYQVTATGPWV